MATAKTSYKADNGKKTEQIVLEAVATLRRNPEKYRDLHKALKRAKSDEARVKKLLKFATSDRDLATLIPSRALQTETAAAITTVTVTTVFIIVDTAY